MSIAAAAVTGSATMSAASPESPKLAAHQMKPATTAAAAGDGRPSK